MKKALDRILGNYGNSAISKQKDKNYIQSKQNNYYNKMERITCRSVQIAQIPMRHSICRASVSF
ncbi:hypothetical protein [uncultured Methanobrevibacter sp.]|uniref:hypothetical protein n=1 Tax=uncultured Methanobrevibacter sp. TaxID=253161 RepID=UPI0025D11427|nr:hypothetical protein [uncultured Methanobrevibacter sp.]